MINIPGNTGNVGESALCLIVQGNGPGGTVLSLSFPAVRTFLVNYDLTNCSGYANMVYVASSRSDRKREMKVTLELTIEQFLWLKGCYDTFTHCHWVNPSDEEQSVFANGDHAYREQLHERVDEKLRLAEAK